jgi:hypothetical protein
MNLVRMVVCVEIKWWFVYELMSAPPPWQHPSVPKWPRGRGASQGRGITGGYLCMDVPHRAAAPQAATPRLPKEALAFSVESLMELFMNFLIKPTSIFVDWPQLIMYQNPFLLTSHRPVIDSMLSVEAPP